MLNDLKEWFGKRCSGVRVNGEIMDNINIPSKQLKFCEAVNYSFDVPLLINNENLDCPGARRTVGFDNQNNELAKRISGNTKIPQSYIVNALKEIPVVNKSVNTIILGVSEDMEKFLLPDVYIIYTQPKRIMQFIHQISKMEKQPLIAPYSLLSICGNVFARSYQDGEISVSFGCPDSRRFGGVNDDEVVMGIPYKLAERIDKSGVMVDNT